MVINVSTNQGNVHENPRFRCTTFKKTDNIKYCKERIHTPGSSVRKRKGPPHILEHTLGGTSSFPIVSH
jgi:hypothetical protein